MKTQKQNFLDLTIRLIIAIAKYFKIKIKHYLLKFSTRN